MKIIFDFDHTLFDTRSLGKELKNSFRKLEVNKKLFDDTFKETERKKGYYYPQRHFKLIHQQRNEIAIPKLKEKFGEALNKSSSFLYKDTPSFLKKWQGKADLFLLSFGKAEFQAEKIKQSKIEKFFKEVIVTQDINKTKPFKNLFQDDEKIIFIEDNPEALFEVKKSFPKVIAVRINRGEGRYSKEKNNKNIDFSIKNLKELEKILKKI